MRSDLDRLNDILVAIAKIKERVADRLAFQTTRCYRSGLSTTYRLLEKPPVASPSQSGTVIPKSYGRRLLRCEISWCRKYFGLNLDQIWMTTQKELPKLVEQVQHIRAGIAADFRSNA